MKVLEKGLLPLRKGILALSVVCAALFSLVAGAVELTGPLTQGTMLRGKVDPGSQVSLNGQAVKVSTNGEFVLGFGRDAKLEHTLLVSGESGQVEKNITLAKREYDIQRIEGVAKKYVSPPKSVLNRIKQDNVQIAKARAVDTDAMYFLQDFIWPAEGRVSGIYGSQRYFNGEPRRPHFGIDVAAPTGTPVVAPADGVVTLWLADAYYSGGTLIVDHGFGISSTFIHLSKSDVAEGDKVKQGQKIAEIGATGRVTGPHLDWRINWFKERLDPGLLVPKRN